MRRDANALMVERVAAALGPLREQMVFLGGCATGFLVTDAAAIAVRATRDVDLIVEATSRTAYHRLEGRLSRLGFEHDASEGAPICRWTLDDLVVDVMPTDSFLLGFTNRWYPEAIRSSFKLTLATGLEISLVSPPCFLATKLEAFHGRGHGDFAASHDIEDLVCVVDGRVEIVEDVRASDEALQAYFRDQLERLLGDDRFLSALPGHLPSDSASQNRLPLLRRRLAAIAGTE